MALNKKTLISMLIELVVALGVAFAAAFAFGFSTGTAAHLNCRYLSDGCFISAVMFIGIGGLMWIASTGFFDIFGYAFKSLLVLFVPIKKPSEFPHYYEYKCEKDAKREGKSVTYTVLISGLIVLALSVLMLVLYYQLAPVEPVV